jgi:Phosphate-selective porin O and P
MKRGFLLSALLLAAPALFAQPASLHVFGGWAYGRTNGNAYLAGTRDGEFDNANVALNVGASPIEQLRLEGQVEVELDRGVQQTQFDFAFAEWRFSDAVRFRVGRLKHPFGIYTEIYDVGTLRPFLALPQSVYGPAGTLAEAYNGVGLSGFRKLGPRWSVAYDVYAGELDLRFADFEHELELNADGSLDVKNVVGGRAIVETPVDGLSFGASAYRGSIHAAGARIGHRALGAQAEYLTDRLSLRGEWTRNVSGASSEHGQYAEAAWRFTPHWQAAARVDAIHEQRDASLDGHHHEAAAGINYWFTPQFVVKLSGHRVHGTHFTKPDAVTGAMKDRTNLLMFGAQFSF